MAIPSNPGKDLQPGTLESILKQAGLKQKELAPCFTVTSWFVERGDNNYSAYAPDVPGCVAVGDTIEQTLSSMKEALELYFEGTRENGEPAPRAYSVHAALVEFEAPAGVAAQP